MLGQTNTPLTLTMNEETLPMYSRLQNPEMEQSEHSKNNSNELGPNPF